VRTLGLSRRLPEADGSGRKRDMKTSEAEAAAVALMTAARTRNDACALLAARLAFSTADDRVLISFCLVEACWSWAPWVATSEHPVLGPTLEALRAGDDGVVRSSLVAAMTGKTAGSYAALLVQLAHATVLLVPDIDARLRTRGLALAANPAATGDRWAGDGR
jgi:hypothetical protein